LKISLFYITVVSLSFAACSSTRIAKERHNSITLVADSSLFENKDSLGLFIITSNGASSGSESIYFTGSKQYKVRTSTPAFISIEREQNNVFRIYPGEPVLIKRNGDYSGNYAILNDSSRNLDIQISMQLNELMLNKSGNLFYKYKLTDSLSGLDIASRNTILTDIDSYVKSNYKSLNSLSAKFNLDSFLVNERVRLIQSDSLNVVYWLLEKFKSELYPGDAWDTECKQLIRDVESMVNQQSLSFFSNNINYLFQAVRDFHKVGSIRDSDGFIEQYHIIENYFNGVSKDYLLATIINTTVPRRITIPDSLIKRFKTNCSVELYKKEVIKTVTKYKKLSHHEFSRDKSDLFSTNPNRKITLNKLLKQNSGRVILVDFWASWCLPCRQKMSSLKKIMDLYKANNDIVFLSISIDKNIENWQKACLIDNLDSKNNFVFFDASKSEFLRNQNIETIPRYILIKNGEIIDNDAPSPDDPKLLEKIRKALE